VFRTIVVGTDGSETASVAVARAVELAKLTNATLHVVYAYQPLGKSQAAAVAVVAGPTVDIDQVNADVSAAAEEVCGQAARLAESADVKVATHERSGDPADALVAVAKDLGADVIVVGNRGMSGVRRFVLGSVPNKVSHHCPCSLLIVDTTPTSS